MGTIKNDTEVTSLRDYRLDKTRDLIRRLAGLSQVERIVYFKNISLHEIEIIEDILLNVVRGNVPLNKKIFNYLKRIKKYIYLLISKKISKKTKKRILYSLKGLQIITLLLPIVKSYLE